MTSIMNTVKRAEEENYEGEPRAGGGESAHHPRGGQPAVPGAWVRVRHGCRDHEGRGTDPWWFLRLFCVKGRVDRGCTRGRAVEAAGTHRRFGGLCGRLPVGGPS